jgi:hypothetical protein
MSKFLQIFQNIRMMKQGTGILARPLPIAPSKPGTIFRKFAERSAAVREIPAPSTMVPGVRGGLLRGNGKLILLYRQILQEKMQQGIPAFMAARQAMDEARRKMAEQG